MSQEPAVMVVEEPPLNLYKVLAFVALLALTMALLEKQLGILSFLPACFGLLGLLGNRPAAPLLLLAAVSLAVPISAAGFMPRSLTEIWSIFSRLYRSELPRAQRIDPIPDFLACAAIMIYLGAYFRLKGIETNLFPPDSRKAAADGPVPTPRGSLPSDLSGTDVTPLQFMAERGSAVATTTRSNAWKASKPLEKRSLDLVQVTEVVLFLAALPIWCGLAALGLFWLVRASTPLTLFVLPWRAPLLLLWFAAFILALLFALLSFKAVSEAEPEENFQLLQDLAWQQTRHEQARIERWFTWARLRAQRRKEKR